MYAATEVVAVPVTERNESLWGDIFNDDENLTPLGSEAERYLAEQVTTHPDKGGPNVLAYWKVSERYIYSSFHKSKSILVGSACVSEPKQDGY